MTVANAIFNANAFNAQIANANTFNALWTLKTQNLRPSVSGLEFFEISSLVDYLNKWRTKTKINAVKNRALCLAFYKDLST